MSSSIVMQRKDQPSLLARFPRTIQQIDRCVDFIQHIGWTSRIVHRFDAAISQLAHFTVAPQLLGDGAERGPIGDP